MRPRTRLRPAARIARAKAEAARLTNRERRAARKAMGIAADETILEAMKLARLPISTADLTIATGLTASTIERRMRLLRAAGRIRWIPRTTWTPGWAFPREDYQPHEDGTSRP